MLVRAIYAELDFRFFKPLGLGRPEYVRATCVQCSYIYSILLRLEVPSRLPWRMRLHMIIKLLA
jgi:hypothetical protein